jgi:hypothetical protein
VWKHEHRKRRQAMKKLGLFGLALAVVLLMGVQSSYAWDHGRCRGGQGYCGSYYTGYNPAWYFRNYGCYSGPGSGYWYSPRTRPYWGGGGYYYGRGGGYCGGGFGFGGGYCGNGLRLGFGARW